MIFAIFQALQALIFERRLMVSSSSSLKKEKESLWSQCLNHCRSATHYATSAPVRLPADMLEKSAPTCVVVALLYDELTFAVGAL